MTERAWIDTSGNERLRGTIVPEPGGGLPDPITDPVNIAVGSDVVGLTVTAPAAGSANILEVVPDDPGSTLAIDSNSRFRKDQFVFIASEAAGGSAFSIPATATFEIDNDDTGDPILKATAGTPNVVEINGVAFENAFPVALGDGDFVSIASAAVPLTQFVFQRAGAALQMSLRLADVEVFRVSTDGSIFSTSNSPFTLPAAPEVPATPLPQDIVDALVTLGLVTQA